MDVLVGIWVFLIGSIAGVVVGLTLVYRVAVYPLHKKIEKLSGEKQVEPYMDKYPYDQSNFRYIGDPVDGLQFEDDHILFVEFNPDHSELSQKQIKIKQLVEKGCVEWFEFKG